MSDYPNISCYMETLSNPRGMFRTLERVEMSRGYDGGTGFIAGSNSVVFRVKISDRPCVMKCYTKALPGRDYRYAEISARLSGESSPYIVDFEYIPEEIFVYKQDGSNGYLPVLLMEDIPGITLGAYLREACNRGDVAAVTSVAAKFDAMALWLLDSDFAHGDLKYDNIIVTPAGDLRLIDYDGMFVDAFRGEVSSELGTSGFQHPARSKSDFGAESDDYSIALISASLHALAEMPQLSLSGVDNMVFDPMELIPGKSVAASVVKDRWLSEGRGALYSLVSALRSRTPRIEGLKDLVSSIAGHCSMHTPEFTGCTDGIVLFRRDGFYGFYDELRRFDTGAVYDDARPFSEGLAAVRIMKRRFYIDTEGRIALDAAGYDYCGDFSEGLAVVGRGERYGYIDKSGDVVIDMIFDSAAPFREGLATVGMAGLYGYIYPSGNVAVPLRYRCASSFSEGVAVVACGASFGYIGVDGEFLLEPRFDYASPISGGRGAAELGDRTFSIIKEGNTIRYA